jgi:hypothetical protein
MFSANSTGGKSHILDILTSLAKSLLRARALQRLMPRLSTVKKVRKPACFEGETANPKPPPTVSQARRHSEGVNSEIA